MAPRFPHFSAAWDRLMQYGRREPARGGGRGTAAPVPVPSLQAVLAQSAQIPTRAAFDQRLGQGAADEFVTQGYNKYMAGKATQTANYTDSFIDVCNDGMQTELRKVTENEDRLRRFQLRAVTGTFRRELMNPRNQENLSQKPYQQNLNDEFERAAAWVVSHSSSIRDEDRTTLTQIAGVMRNAVQSGQDLFSIHAFRQLHQDAGLPTGTTRWGATQGNALFYTGPVAGRRFQQTVFDGGRLIGNMPHGPAGGAKWYDVATYLMLGNIVAHGFPDGNGRVCRMYYACLLIANGMPLVVPEYRWILNETTEQNLGRAIHEVPQTSLCNHMWPPAPLPTALNGDIRVLATGQHQLVRPGNIPRPPFAKNGDIRAGRPGSAAQPGQIG